MARLADDTDERDYSVFNNARVVGISADGRTLLLRDRPHGGSILPGAYLRRHDPPAPIRLFDRLALALTPDGAYVVRATPGDGGIALVPTGVGESKTLVATSAMDWDRAEVARSGTAVLEIGAPSGRPRRCYVQAIDGLAQRAVTPEGVEQCRISPDGRAVVGANGTDVISIYAADGASPPRRAAGTLPGDLPVRWAGDGRRLFVRAAGRMPARVFVVDLVSGGRTAWRSLMPADPAGVFTVDGPIVAADGDTYAYNYSRFLFDLYQVDGLR
jgi:hypothetical protein